MMLIAAAWISFLLLVGGVALDRTLTGLVSRNFDEQLNYMLTAMIGSVEIDSGGEVFFNRPLGDQRFLEPNSGLYWQISGKGHEDYASRSLWDRTLKIETAKFLPKPQFYDSDQFAGQGLRIVERTVVLPGSPTQWRFAVAANRDDLDAQIARIRSILVWSFVVLGLGLFLMAVLQTWYGLGPLRRVRLAIKRMRTTGANRITDPLPLEVQPLVQELNALLAHSIKQAEEARTHAGNLAHALKTPLTVVMNAATAKAPDLSDTVIREAAVMRRQVDHHLARARAVGRRAVGLSRASVGDSVEAVLRAVTRLYEDTRFDLAGDRGTLVAIERQDLDEILGNLIENAAKYGGGSVFVTIDAEPAAKECLILVEDDGMGIPPEERTRIFDRGARLDTGKPGTGLGLAIVRDVAEIYGGTVDLAESEDLGGLMVELRLPRAG
ncbi:MAG: HAMP domain-containing sensor histidine kinase [Candidatus Andeanibacterium colombiense]|uniref:histidine kinase n=1 Tax=Candidatus Andeanibacterium colombiense TaxID=3121345 RepID=A0AAJ5X9P4_9SPHN|nr:MAG: HAMP domain-containing sensor histidine kinase [Sphingomonadaceae bacterium]